MCRIDTAYSATRTAAAAVGRFRQATEHRVWSRVPVLSHMSGVARITYRFNERLCERYAGDEAATPIGSANTAESAILFNTRARHFTRTTGPPRPKLEQQHRTSMSGTGPQARCHAEHEVDQNPHEADSREDQETTFISAMPSYR
jgi:hypothetical protein